MTRFNQWYKSKIESHPEDPPEVVWDSIQDELDMEQVWTRLEAGLDQRQRKKALLIFSMAASLTLMITIGSIFFFTTKSQPEIASLETLSPAEPHTPPSLHQLQPVPEKLQPLEGVFALSEIKYPLTGKIQKETTEHPAISVSDLFSPAHKEIQSLTVETHSRENLSENPTQSSLIAEILEPVGKGQFFFIGFTGQLANTWMLNQKTRQGLNPEELTHTNLSFGKNFGILAGTRINERMSLQEEFYFVSQKRQGYNEYLNGQFVSSRLELDYSTLSLLIKYRITENSPHFVAAGIYGSSLNNASQKIDSQLTDVRSEYNSMDYGLVAGYEYQYPIYGNWYLGAGLFFRYGVKNIFSGNEMIPDYLNRTQNAAFNASFSLNYAFF